MHRLRTGYLGWAAAVLLLLIPAPGLAASGAAEAIVIVADTRAVPGWQAWWANLYNESLLYFTVVTVITIPLVGVVLGVLTDFFMSRVGINLRSRAVAEH